MTSAPIFYADAAREALASSYEELRKVALARGSRYGRGTGFALFIRSGTARWMDTCVALLARPTTAPPPRQLEEQPHVSADIRVEVAMVLAQMALSAQAQGATTC